MLKDGAQARDILYLDFGSDCFHAQPTEPFEGSRQCLWCYAEMSRQFPFRSGKHEFSGALNDASIVN